MNAVYAIAGASKQGFHQYLNRRLRQQDAEAQLLPVIRQIRADHPKLSVRKMYWMVKPDSMGRDRFEAFCLSEGFGVAVVKNYQRTTYSLGVTRFENLLLQMRELTAINQVWVSDITYFRLGERFYYLTFIMDRFSRRIIGYQASESLLTEQTTLPALEQAITTRKGQAIRGTIFHSDGGGQYYCKQFLALTARSKLKNSMAESVYENPHAERVNGIIKNEYLVSYTPSSFQQLKRMLHKAVRLYNTERPHLALAYQTPVAFEQKNMTKKRNYPVVQSPKTVNLFQA